MSQIYKKKYSFTISRIQKIPENWGPLVTKKLQFGTEIALFSQDQFNEISMKIKTFIFIFSTFILFLESTLKAEDNDTSSKEALQEKSKQLIQGWTHSKEHQKRFESILSNSKQYFNLIMQTSSY